MHEYFQLRSFWQGWVNFKTSQLIFGHDFTKNYKFSSKKVNHIEHSLLITIFSTLSLIFIVNDGKKVKIPSLLFAKILSASGYVNH